MRQPKQTIGSGLEASELPNRSAYFFWPYSCYATSTRSWPQEREPDHWLDAADKSKTEILFRTEKLGRACHSTWPPKSISFPFISVGPTQVTSPNEDRTVLETCWGPNQRRSVGGMGRALGQLIPSLSQIQFRASCISVPFGLWTDRRGPKIVEMRSS